MTAEITAPRLGGVRGGGDEKTEEEGKQQTTDRVRVQRSNVDRLTRQGEGRPEAAPPSAAAGTDVHAQIKHGE